MQAIVDKLVEKAALINDVPTTTPLAMNTILVPNLSLSIGAIGPAEGFGTHSRINNIYLQTKV